MRTHVVRLRKVKVVLVGLLSIWAIAMGTAPASASIHDPEPRVQGSSRHCLVTVDSAHQGRGDVAPVLEERCVRSNRPPAIPKGRILLLRIYDGSNFGGDSTSFIDSAGAGVYWCDAEGFSINYVGNAWNDRTSSFRTYSRCNHVTAYWDANRRGICRSYYRDQSYVGTLMDNDISSFRLSSNLNFC